MKKIITFTTVGDNREDGNVYYSGHIIVESPTLKFDEPIFDDYNSNPELTCSQMIYEIKQLGYIVEEPESLILSVTEMV